MDMGILGPDNSSFDPVTAGKPATVLYHNASEYW
jgi:hypothetical protein